MWYLHGFATLMVHGKAFTMEELGEANYLPTLMVHGEAFTAEELGEANQLLNTREKPALQAVFSHKSNHKSVCFEGICFRLLIEKWKCFLQVPFLTF